MEISEDRAYWLLSSYRDRSTVLDFGGSILEHAEYCSAVVLGVDQELHVIVVELFEPGHKKKWVSTIQLKGATFTFSMLSEAGFKGRPGFSWHSVLEITFSDSTRLVFAESAR